MSHNILSEHLVWWVNKNMLLSQSDNKLSSYSTKQIKGWLRLDGLWQVRRPDQHLQDNDWLAAALNSSSDRVDNGSSSIERTMTQQQMLRWFETSDDGISTQDKESDGMFPPGYTLLLFIWCSAVLHVILSSVTLLISQGRPEERKMSCESKYKITFHRHDLIVVIMCTCEKFRSSIFSLWKKWFGFVQVQNQEQLSTLLLNKTFVHLVMYCA